MPLISPLMPVPHHFLQLWYTKNLAFADKLRDMFRGQSRSPYMVPFYMLGMDISVL